MLDIFREKIEEAIGELRAESKRRGETTPSDTSIEAFDFAARRVERALAEADDASRLLTPAQYGELHGGVTEQTVTRWIRIGELQAEKTPAGYRIARDAVRVARIHPDTLGRTG